MDSMDFSIYLPHRISYSVNGKNERSEVKLINEPCDIEQSHIVKLNNGASRLVSLTNCCLTKGGRRRMYHDNT